MISKMMEQQAGPGPDDSVSNILSALFDSHKNVSNLAGKVIASKLASQSLPNMGGAQSQGFTLPGLQNPFQGGQQSNPAPMQGPQAPQGPQGSASGYLDQAHNASQVGPPPQMGNAFDTKHLLGAGVILLLSHLMGGGRVGGAAALGGFMKGAQGDMDRRYQNDLSKYQSKQQQGQVDANYYTQKAGLTSQDEDRNWKATQAERDRQAHLKGLEITADANKNKGLTAAQTASLKSAQDTIRSADSPGAAKYAAGLYVNSIYEGYYSPEGLDQLKQYTPKQQQQLATAGNQSAQGKKADAETQTINATREQRVKNLVSEGKWKDAMTATERYNKELKRMGVQWFAADMKSKINQRNTMSATERINANANMYRALHQSDPKGLDAATKQEIDAQADLTESSSMASKLKAKLAQMEADGLKDDPKFAKVSDDLDKATAATAGNQHRLNAVRTAKAQIQSNLRLSTGTGVPPKPNLPDGQILMQAAKRVKSNPAQKKDVNIMLASWGLKPIP